MYDEMPKFDNGDIVLKFENVEIITHKALLALHSSKLR